jgi:hypothetical protein
MPFSRQLEEDENHKERGMIHFILRMNGLHILFVTLEPVIDCDIEISLVPGIWSAFKFSINYFILLQLTQNERE